MSAGSLKKGRFSRPKKEGLHNDEATKLYSIEELVWSLVHRFQEVIYSFVHLREDGEHEEIAVVYLKCENSSRHSLLAIQHTSQFLIISCPACMGQTWITYFAPTVHTKIPQDHFLVMKEISYQNKSPSRSGIISERKWQEIEDDFSHQDRHRWGHLAYPLATHLRKRRGEVGNSGQTVL